ncbi:MAG: hemerythrin domain-containing protein [Myxococcaceae bacterium]|nr:hemerythrin domain-containing protein [Myxococcaceae bacterium]
MDLLKTLKAQHALLEEKCLALTARLEENDCAGARALLAELHAEFMAHIRLESEALFPPLLAGAEAQKATAQLSLARSFETGVGIICDALGRAAARPADDQEVDAFAQDWATLLHALRSRFAAEEASLFPMYARFARR